MYANVEVESVGSWKTGWSAVKILQADYIEIAFELFSFIRLLLIEQSTYIVSREEWSEFRWASVWKVFLNYGDESKISRK